MYLPLSLNLANLVLYLQKIIPFSVSHSTHNSLPASQNPLHEPTTMTNDPSRTLTITTTHQSVTGTYDLYDALHITTSSGSVNIIVNPKPASSSDPTKPAELYIKTSSGSIRVETSGVGVNNVPNRTYISTLISSSGSIYASPLLHGRSTTLYTSSGRIEASLYPFTGPGANTTTTRGDIRISSSSGSQQIHVHPCLNFPHAPIRNLYGDYKHQSGKLTLTYPLTWEGSIAGSSSSGSVNYEWPGLRVSRMGNQFAATKGSAGSGTLTFSGSSGSTRLYGVGGTLEEERQEGRDGVKEEVDGSNSGAAVEGQPKIEPGTSHDGAPPTYQDAVGGREYT